MNDWRQERMKEKEEIEGEFTKKQIDKSES